MNAGKRAVWAIAASAKGFFPLAGLLVIWQWAGQGSPNFPPPSRSFATLQILASSGALRPALFATILTLVAGLIGASMLGFILGLLIGTIAPLRRWSYFILEFLRALPPPIVVPVAVLFVGYTQAMEIGVVTVAASWPILLNTVSGTAGVNPLILDVARSFKMDWRERVTKVIIPSVVPSFLTGVRVAMPLAIVLTLLVEMLTGLPGLGVLMIQGQRNFNSSQVFAVLAVVAVLGYALHLIFSFSEKLILRNRSG